MKTKSLFCCLLLTLLMSSFKEMPVQKQRINFKVKLAGATVGTLVAEQSIQDSDQIIYTLNSKVKVDMLFTIGVDESITDVFEKTRLIQSEHTRHVNHKVKAHNTLSKQGGTYKLKNKNNGSPIIVQEITETVLSIYFKEPSNGQTLFSHNFQKMLTVERIGEGRYKVELPNNNTTFFQYRRGKLYSVQSNTDWGTIIFERID